ncbi:hypothetical protein GCM10028857_17570 [Salinarchaeum chitinilyticum]
MAATFLAFVIQIGTQFADVGLDALTDRWSLLVRAGWFCGAFLLVVVPGWYLLVPAVTRIVRNRNRNNPTLEEAIARYLSLFLFLLAVFLGAAVAGYTGFLTNSAIVIAAATLALGVAGQSVIGSLVSGTVLVLDPQFNVGDYIEWEGGQGTVRSITLRVTRVQTLDGEMVTVPNELLTNQSVTRPFGHGRFQVVQRVSLSYDDDLEAALTQLETAAVELEASLDAPDPQVFVEEFGGDAVVARVQFWIEDPDRRDVVQVRSQFARTVKRRLDAAGLTIAPAAKRDLQGEIEVAEPA